MIWQKALECEQESRSYVTVTILEAKGSIPQEIGAKCLVTSHGLEAGTVGGGKVEARTIERAQEILLSEKKCFPISITWNLQRDIKMTCGGEVTLLFEHFPANNWPIVIFGAGHVAQALSRVLSSLKCNLTIIDPREEWLNKIKGIQTICHKNPADMVAQFPSHSFFISMTKGHSFDVPILLALSQIHPQAPYIGAIGSNTKALAIKKELKERGVAEDFLERLRIPIGLPLGTNEPEEISISIAAELLKVRDELA